MFLSHLTYSGVTEEFGPRCVLHCVRQPLSLIYSTILVIFICTCTCRIQSLSITSLPFSTASVLPCVVFPHSISLLINSILYNHCWDGIGFPDTSLHDRKFPICFCNQISCLHVDGVTFFLKERALLRCCSMACAPLYCMLGPVLPLKSRTKLLMTKWSRIGPIM